MIEDERVGCQETRKPGKTIRAYVLRIIDLVVSEIMRTFANVNEIEDGGPLSFLYRRSFGKTSG